MKFLYFMLTKREWPVLYYFLEPYWCKCGVICCNDDLDDVITVTSPPTPCDDSSNFQHRPISSQSTRPRVASTAEVPQNTDLPPVEERSQHDQPIIVLQEAPVIVTTENLNFYANEEPQFTAQNYNNRSQQRRRHSVVYNSTCNNSGRQTRLNSRRHSDVQTMLLNPAALENIITRNGAVPAMFRGNSNNTRSNNINRRSSEVTQNPQKIVWQSVGWIFLKCSF